MEFSTVIGVDSSHLEQLRLTWPTWKRHKPIVTTSPLVVFYDAEQVKPDQVWEVIENHRQASVVPWFARPQNIPDRGDKWTNRQRYKMLSGFVHIPARYVGTRYWLKIDTDVVATKNDRAWPTADWFRGDPAIVSAAWGYTKPPDQMQFLDDWYDSISVTEPIGDNGIVPVFPRLDLRPTPGASRLPHSRITSFVGFFNTQFVRECSEIAKACCGDGLPVPSQDGYLWFMATRTRRGVVRMDMKAFGWQQWHRTENIAKAVREALK